MADAFGGTANGGVDTFQRQFTVTVNPVNDPPTLDAINNLVINEDAGLQTVNLAGISAGPANESGQTLTITAVSSNTSIVPHPTVNYTSPNATGSLTFTPVADAFGGPVTITVTVQDDGGTANGGVDTVQRQFTVTVADVPVDPPSASNVRVTGNSRVGQTLAGHYDYDGELPEGASTFVWRRANSAQGTFEPIAGATGQTYRLVAADKDQFIKFEVTPVDNESNAGDPALSAAIGPVGGSILVYDPIPTGGGVNYIATQDVGSTDNREVGKTEGWDGQGVWNGNWNSTGRKTVASGTLSYEAGGYALQVSGGKLADAGTGAMLRRFSSSGISSGTYISVSWPPRQRPRRAVGSFMACGSIREAPTPTD